MQHNDLKFFTNEPERDLYSRFATILKSNTQFFDVLVGYFRASGFFKLYKSLETVEKIRILVGLNVDKFTVKIIDQATNEAKVASISATDGKEIIAGEVEREFEEAANSAEVEKGVRIFLDWLKSGKLEMRMFTDAPIHAKVYILRKDQEKVPDTFGSAITGSSNFSEAGLINKEMIDSLPWTTDGKEDVVTFVKQIMALDPEKDTGQIAEIDALINAKVYEMFSLSQSEIEMIETTV